MLTRNCQETWSQFLEYIEEHASATEVENWFKPVKVLEATEQQLTLEVPNIFVQEYLLNNYKKELALFVPLQADGEPALRFAIAPTAARKAAPVSAPPEVAEEQQIRLNGAYTFDNFIEGPSNQFVKSAAMGVANKPGKSYNPLFIHGGVGLGKTHLLHAIVHNIKKQHKKLRCHWITTEGFINELVHHLRTKSIDRMKHFYRSLDVLLVDDIQFLQNRLNFEEEICNTFEALLQQSRQIVITSDKAPGQLKLSERMVARMEWGLVTNVCVPDLETRVAILQHKAEQRGVALSQKVAFFIAEQIFHNVRQLEGAINRLCAYCRFLSQEITEEFVSNTLGELLLPTAHKAISVEDILSSVATVFDVRVSDLRGSTRTKEIAFPRQVAMYLAKELVKGSLSKLSASFGGKAHSTLLHAWNKIVLQLEKDEPLRRQLQMVRRHLATPHQ